MRTFVFSDIQQGYLPATADFSTLLEFTRHTLRGASQHIACAIVGGSTIVGTPTETSDLDLVVIASSDAPMQLLGPLQSIRAEADRLCIPIDGPVLTTVAEQERGSHTISPGYARHLLWAAERGGLLLGDAAALRPVPITNREDAQRYISHKLRKVRTACVQVRPGAPEDTGSMEMRSDILTCWEYAGRRFAEATLERLDDEPALAWAAWIPDQALPYLEELRLARSLHRQRIAQQILSPNRKDWTTALGDLDTALTCLETYLSILERNL